MVVAKNSNAQITHRYWPIFAVKPCVAETSGSDLITSGIKEKLRAAGHFASDFQLIQDSHLKLAGQVIRRREKKLSCCMDLKKTQRTTANDLDLAETQKAISSKL